MTSFSCCELRWWHSRERKLRPLRNRESILWKYENFNLQEICAFHYHIPFGSCFSYRSPYSHLPLLTHNSILKFAMTWDENKRKEKQSQHDNYVNVLCTTHTWHINLTHFFFLAMTFRSIIIIPATGSMWQPRSKQLRAEMRFYSSGLVVSLLVENLAEHEEDNILASPFKILF